MTDHPCKHWKDGRCSKGLFGGSPSIGVCMNRCAEYDGPERTQDLIERLTQITVSAKRPTPTVRQAATFARAIITGKYVSDEIREEREATCRRCEFQRVDENGSPWCGVCGCRTSNDARKIRNLAAYEENLPHWGCKHPYRSAGQGWQR